MAIEDDEHRAAVQHLFYGHKSIPLTANLELCWKAVKSVAVGDGVVSEGERLCLLGLMCATLTPPEVVERVLEWDEHSAKPSVLLGELEQPPEYRRGTGAWIVYTGLVVAMADGLSPGELERICSVAMTMDVDPEVVYALHRITVEESVLRQRRIDALAGRVLAPHFGA